MCCPVRTTAGTKYSRYDTFFMKTKKSTLFIFFIVVGSNVRFGRATTSFTACGGFNHFWLLVLSQLPSCQAGDELLLIAAFEWLDYSAAVSA